jgi:hypothetical protein
MRIHPLIAAGAVALAALPAAAQSLKPGLWEVQNKVSTAGMPDAMAEMQKQMAAMPPEQRKQMEAMMAQHGMRMAPGTGGGIATQMCMTREMVERNELPMDEGCRMTQQQRTGNTMRMAFTCTKPPSTGEGEFTFLGPEAYRSRMTVKVTDKGRTETATVEGSAKWLSADCGKVKPIAPTRK